MSNYGRRRSDGRVSLSPVMMLALGALLVLGGIAVALLIRGERDMRGTVNTVAQEAEILTRVRELSTTLLEAETGQRGYLLTGDETYLEPYNRAGRVIPVLLSELERDLASEPDHEDELARLSESVLAQLGFMRRTVELYRAGNKEEAIGTLRTGKGRELMLLVRTQLDELVGHHRMFVTQFRQTQLHQLERVHWFAFGGGAIAMFLAGLAAWFANLYDSRQRQTEATLAAACEAAQEANRMKSGFLAAASHDLRQPLHAILLFVSALRRRVAGDQAIDIVDKIGISAQSMQRMFSAVLDVSKLDAGAIQAAPRAFPLQDVLQRLRTEFAGRAGEKGLELSLPHEDHAVRSDPVLLESILRNLLSNAINFTATGKVTMTARVSGDSLRLEVADTGPGMNAQQLARVFDEFWRGENGGSSERGLGLGLSIARRTAELLGLTLAVDSTPGQGARFHFNVPLAERAAPAALRPVIAGQLTGKVVMIVDDEPLVRDATAREVRDWQATVVTAFSSENAIDTFRANGRTPDLLIIDFDLRSKLNGLELATQLAKLAGRPLPTIIVTGSTDEVSLRRFRNAGCHWLIKPIDPADLRTTALELLA